MATIAAHLSVEALRERYVSSSNAREARHFHTIWLLAKGHTLGEVAEMTSFGQRWIEQLAARYNAEGPESLGDLRRRNGSSATVLKPELLDKLRLRLKEPPDDGGLWTSAKVAAFLARELGLEKVAVQRGWEALKACRMSIQLPRPKNPQSASPEEAAAFKKTSKTPSRRKPRHIPSARSRSRPIAHGHHRFDWLYVTAFVSPASGETFWYVHDGVSKPFFAALLETFAREAKAGVDRTIVLVIDNAGWHGEAGLSVPDGVRLVFLPPYTPELQPAETLWTLVDEPIVNKHVETIDELDAIIGERCAALANERDIIKSRAGFHWWPKIAKPK